MQDEVKNIIRIINIGKWFTDPNYQEKQIQPLEYGPLNKRVFQMAVDFQIYSLVFYYIIFKIRIILIHKNTTCNQLNNCMRYIPWTDVLIDLFGKTTSHLQPYASGNVGITFQGTLFCWETSAQHLSFLLHN